jgi:anti-repressor protein
MNTQLVYSSKKGNPVTDSKKVADLFGKRHDNVIRDINSIIAQVSENEHQLKSEGVKNYFYKNEYVDAKGESRPLFVMNQDGFTLLAMGFTGPKAMGFKLQYIGEFNRMREELATICETEGKL